MFFSHSLLVASSSLLERYDLVLFAFQIRLSSLCLADHIRRGFQRALFAFNTLHDFSFF